MVMATWLHWFVMERDLTYGEILFLCACFSMMLWVGLFSLGAWLLCGN